jgi:hypothetical protein
LAIVNTSSKNFKELRYRLSNVNQCLEKRD